MKKVLVFIFILIICLSFSSVYIKNGYLNFVITGRDTSENIQLVFEDKNYDFFYINGKLKCYIPLPKDGIYSFYYLKKNNKILEKTIFQKNNKNIIYIINGKISNPNSFANTYYVLENTNKITAYVEKNDLDYFYDTSIFGNINLISPYFTFKSNYDFGYSKTPYAYMSFMGFLGNETLNLGYKNTLMTGRGYYLKYYTNFFEKKYFFSIRDYSGADKVSKENYEIIPVYFFNYDGLFDIEYRAYDNPLNVGSLYTVVGNDFKVGMLWSSSKQADLNYLCPEKEKKSPLLIFYAGNNDLSLNFGYYNYSEPYYLATKSIVKEGMNTYYYYFNVDFLKKGLTLYFTINWIPEIYAYINYADELWGFSNIAYNFYLDNLRIYPLLQVYYYKDIKLQFKLYGELKTNFGIFKGGIGTTTYNSVWDGWTIKEEKQDLKFNLNYEYSF
ncbi:hypothetical protein OSSY52_03040 [Tepiditoga spiralis]|uniref:Uncharacterized protein n=1 Tax=Tepiditoga spiralis TaxID=2108365 RepID=A0A7G1G5V4_9BACT|nr:hypothetical protein [Tepiditoga spiralis]BBE30163.1 hypothetical protein OSSY52_03040 [Tepiditoga spiralis]